MKLQQLIESNKTEPAFIDQSITLKQKEEKNKRIHTKLPSLPNLPKKNKEFYNKWYIPYELRYVQKPEQQRENFEDDMHFYKNIHSINVQYNPFDEKLPEILIKNLGYRERTETVKDILKGQRQLMEFKKSLERENQRVPEFIKQLLQNEQINKKYKQFKYLS